MLRAEDGYGLSDPDALIDAAAELRAAGADEFVLGFLDARAAVDLVAVKAVLAAIEGCRWTFHRALDHAADRAAARRALVGLPGLDFVLTAGGPASVAEGLPVLGAEAASRPRVLAERRAAPPPPRPAAGGRGGRVPHGQRGAPGRPLGPPGGRGPGPRLARRTALTGGRTRVRVSGR
nr:hypothetical protein GCM10020092_042630 [Actinoplanes digitatis]